MKKKLVESGIGVKTTEAMARRIDAAMKGLPKGEAYEYRRKGVVADTEVTPGERTDTSKVTTSAMDRDNEIVLPSGIELDQYRLNPVVLYGHDQDRPVGKCLWIKPQDNGLVAKTLYASRPDKFVGEWQPDFVFEMVKADVLRGKSIGFLPLEVREPTDEEVATYPAVRHVISRSLLVEYSVVAVPSNPLALVESIGKGIGLDFWNFKVVGRSKATTRAAGTRKTVNVNGPVADQLARLHLDADRIADEAVKNILKRWEV